MTELELWPSDDRAPASFEVGALVREHGCTGTYRVRALERDGSVTTFGGPRRQWRTFRPDQLRPATKREAREYLEALEHEAPLRRAIRPARALP